MDRALIARLTLLVTAGLAGLALAGDPEPDGRQGWTGITNPADVITARQTLMTEIEELMQPVDLFGAGDPVDPEKVRSAADTLAGMLLAVPHLFPPTTDLFDPKSDLQETLALPAIWQSFPNFYAFAGAAAAAATKTAETAGTEPLRAASRNLRATCDACHAAYLRPYVPSKVTSDDVNFDFDSVLRKN